MILLPSHLLQLNGSKIDDKQIAEEIIDDLKEHNLLGEHQKSQLFIMQNQMMCFIQLVKLQN